MPVGLYLHVPFCRTRCDFCAFYLRIYREADAVRYVSALRHEIDLHADLDSLNRRPVETVYFGGGTPTVLPPGELVSILQVIRTRLDLASHAEVTVEAHPDTVDGNTLRSLVQGGFTRISFGTQSMNRTELIRAGRPTTPNSIIEAVNGARAAGFQSINLDVMYGLPGQDTASWLETLESVLALRPNHLSCYALTVEDGTALDLAIAQNHESRPDAMLQEEMEILGADRLTEAGFLQYEISNFCLPGHASRHNLLYWTAQDYLGLGPSAQSYVNGRRFGNIAHLEAYERALDDGRLPIDAVEHLTPVERLKEAIVFGLRRVDGIEQATIQAGRRAGLLDAAWSRSVTRLQQEGLLESGADRLRLTVQGRRFADSVAVALL